METQKITFYGQVQGVGFRISCQFFANKLGLKGTVHNETNGSVTAILQGEKSMIDKFLRELPNNISNYANITSFEKTKVSETQFYHSFEII